MTKYSVEVRVDDSEMYEEFHEQITEAFKSIQRILDLTSPSEHVTLTDWEGKHEYQITNVTQTTTQGETQ